MVKMAKPPWLRRGVLSSGKIERTRQLLRGLSVDTVCESARCPNISECFAEGRATFIIMGPNCTRRCGFCAVSRGAPGALDPTEPKRVGKAAKRLGLRGMVITSVTRDDLADGGAKRYAEVITLLHKISDEIKVEVLVPDFKGSLESIETVYRAKIDVFAHNLDTVRRLYPVVKPGSDYAISLAVLRKAKGVSASVPTKSGLLLGLGETDAEVNETLGELRGAGCDMITIGQYLRPAAGRLSESRFAPPKIFEKYKKIAYNLGFKNVMSGPFIRSSYYPAEKKGALATGPAKRK